MTGMSSSPRFHLVSGNRLDRLAAHLGARLAAAQDIDSLAPDTVLIPQPSLRHWLLQALAERFGIAANLDLCTPSEFVWRLLRAAHPELPEHSPWERERLRWRLYALLETLRPLPAPVRAHLQRASASGRRDALPLARYDLADALADAFDKYQAYRRDWLTAWEAGEERDDWQATLWRALRAAAPDTVPRATLIGEWLARHDRQRDARIATAPPGLPTRLFAFGTMHVSPDVLSLLSVVAQWIPLDFYLPSPSVEYWGDVESLRERLRRDGVAALPAALADADRDNPLLSAWGAGGREIVAQVFAYDVVLPEREIERYVRPQSDSLLHRLQRDVLDRAAPRPAPWRAGDESLRIHACHSRLREVEVLHDRLRAMLDDALPEGPRFDQPLQPRDIAVLAPNIADYLPLARAVFGGLDADDPRYIPFSLADRPQAHSHPLVGLLFSLLDLADAPLRASAFHDLLAVPAVARAHDLDAAALERLHAWFDAAGVRWGEDEDARERAGVGRWREYSFAFGFDRLLAGYAAGDDATVLGGDGERRDGAFAPYAELEGGDAAALDAALTVHARLRALSLWMRNAHPPAAWQQRLAAEFLALLTPEADDPDEAAARRRVLDALADFAEDAGANARDAEPTANPPSLPAALVRRALEDTLMQPSPHQPWLSGGVTFAGMVPLRTVPFRVICLLGMDADAYPRREPANDVNRLIDAVQGRAPRYPGDRSVRDDDRFLFLQLLCAAGDALHISYGGRDARDGSVREPSALIGELLDVVETMHGAEARRALTIEHPLQPFSPRAFGASDDGRGVDPRRWSYRDEWRLPPTDERRPPKPFAAIDSTLDSSMARAKDGAPKAGETTLEPPDRDALQRFFRNPAQWWLQRCLGLRLPAAEDAERDREPLGDNKLVRYHAIAALIEEEAALARDDDSDAERSDDDARTRLAARTLLPPGHDGDDVSRAAADVARHLLAARADARGDEAPRTVAAHGDDAPHGIAFAFDDVSGATRAIAVAGKLNAKRRLRASLDHLLLASVLGEAATTVLIGEGAREKPKKGEREDAAAHPIERRVWRGIGREDARARLAALLALWREGHAAPLPFAPTTSFAYAEARAKKSPPDERAAWVAAQAAFDPYGDFGGDADDAWIALAFRGDDWFADFDDAVARRFRAIATQVFDATESNA